MKSEKSSNLLNSTHAPQATDAVFPLPTVNVHLTEHDKRKESKLWAPLSALGGFGCMFLLFHLYVSTTFHHAALDHGLQKLEEEVHAMMDMYQSGGNVTFSSAVDAPLVTPVVHHGNHRALLSHEKKHHKSAKRAKSRMVESQPVKRGGSVLTWFHPGLGACGGHNGDNDFVLAISHVIWDGGSHCGETVTITCDGKTAEATVVDECMGCDAGHIDLSPGLLHYLAGAGTDMVTDANWLFGDAEPPESTPTTTYQSTTVQSTSTSTSSTAASSSALPSATAATIYGDDGEVHNIEAFNALLVDLAGMLVAGIIPDN